MPIFRLNFNIDDPENFKKIDFGGYKVRYGTLILIFSVLVGAIIILISVFIGLYKYVDIFPIIVLGAYLVSTVPYIVYKNMELSESKEIEKYYPIFLRELSESISAGLNLVQALKSSTEKDYGALTKYIRKLYIWISWGVNFEKAFEMFNKYFEDNRNIRRINYVILEAYKSGGDLVKTLRSLSDAMESIRELDSLKRSYISQQSMVMYVIYVIFIGLLVMIFNVIQPLVFQQAMISSQQSTFGFSFSPVSIDWLKIISTLSIIIEAISISLIMGYAESNTIRGSLKHIGITTFIGILAILIFVYPPNISIDLSIFPSQTYVYNPVSITLTAAVDGKPVDNGTVSFLIKCVNQTIGPTDVPFENGKAELKFLPINSGQCEINVRTVIRERKYEFYRNITVI